MNQEPMFKVTFHHALDANKDQLEGPWYGVWRYALSRCMECVHYNPFREGHLVCTYIYGQNPFGIHPELSNVHRSPNAPSPESLRARKTPDDPRRPYEKLAKRLFTQPHSPTASPLDPRSPMNEVLEPDGADLDADYVPDDDSDDDTDYETEDKETRRTPDFSRISSFVDLSGGTISNLRDLIVEIKRAFRDISLKAFVDAYAKTRVQVADQAYHAFKSDSNITVMGCIVAIGQYWTYNEYLSENVEGLKKEEGAPILKIVPQFAELGRQLNPNQSLEDQLDEIFAENTFLDLESNESEYALCVIDKRLREMNQGAWDTFLEQQ